MKRVSLALAVRVRGSGRTRGRQAAAHFIDSLKAEIGRRRWAIVVDRPTNHGMGRMAQALLEGASVSVAVLDNLAEAEAWVRGAR